MDLYVIRRPSAWANAAELESRRRQVGQGRQRGDARPRPLDPQLRGQGGRRTARFVLHL